jgi:amino acid transporter
MPFRRLRRVILGAPKPIDPNVFHKMSLVAFLAWVGLGADGLSSSAYGPEEAFRALSVDGQDYTYLAVFLALMTALTVFIISYAYSRIIEHFPHGGGGYVVASKLLGEKAGVLSGCALLVDYVLTISISVASGGDAIFSFLPPAWLPAKFYVQLAAVLVLMLMNLRGVKESVTVLIPIFLLFLLTHIALILGGIISNLGNAGEVLGHVSGSVERDLSALGLWGLLLIFLRAYSLGGGTYTGIEAVSNGLGIMREPRVQTGKRTMVYMAVSLAFTAGGILLCYLLARVHHVPGKTMNAVLAHKTFDMLPLGGVLVVLTLISEGALLFVAAQTGFIDGPRVMAVMASDSWLPRRFAALSDRLTMQNGVVLMSAAALATLVYTHGSVSALVVMYSINVFVTFSLSQAAMCRFWVMRRRSDPTWWRHLPIHIIGFLLCFSILGVTIYEKFAEGGYVTVLITAALIGVCMLIKRHYQEVSREIGRLNQQLTNLPLPESREAPTVDPRAPTAALLVGGYGGLGIYSMLMIHRLFPGYFKNLLFLSVGVIDSGNFKGEE